MFCICSGYMPPPPPYEAIRMGSNPKRILTFIIQSFAFVTQWIDAHLVRQFAWVRIQQGYPLFNSIVSVAGNMPIL